MQCFGYLRNTYCYSKSTTIFSSWRRVVGNSIVLLRAFASFSDSFYLPFKLDQKQALEAFRKWNRSLLLHRHFKDTELTVEKLYVPFYIFEAALRVNYTCEIGFAETVRLKSKLDNKESVFETWSWHPISGSLSEVEYPPSLGIMQVYGGFERLKRYMNFIRSLEIAGTLPYHKDLSKEARIESFALDEEDAFNNIRLLIYEREEKRCRIAIQKEYGAERIRNLRTNLVFKRFVTKRIFLPAFEVSFSGVGGRTFKVWINGRDGDTTGDRMYSILKSSLAGATISTSTFVLCQVAGIAPWLELTDLLSSLLISSFSSGFLAYFSSLFLWLRSRIELYSELRYFQGYKAEKDANQHEETFRRAYERRKQDSYESYNRRRHPPTTAPTRSYYDILGLPPGASIEQVKLAFRKLAMQHHPDRQQDSISKQKASERFREIVTAYETLKDPVKKREYDRDKV
ncbi:DnaJ homolog subfamily C member 3 [Galdieria sulphuraria]|uniref:DnaJ homolog subfamily C member 3 n=1 Tax=Galdieria sulphuraria TaxID=130081 RepID=M2XC43_GALSU|nr:DnaJ homolog subfamily C member 3 [Galdieria sulphuraria]EME27472.1 DnaJ homolog subfamily C member 3 [Galdieria sulphuraria]|eukprot:XP_005703992.1 DnaJ homolog subfamily C member 3 [Galdieria sulphuraria]